MPRPSLLILSIMLIVFSLTLMGGGGNYMFVMSPTITDDLNLHNAIFWLGTLVALVGLAGFLAGLAGVLGAVLARTAEMRELQAAANLQAEAENEEERR